MANQKRSRVQRNDQWPSVPWSPHLLSTVSACWLSASGQQMFSTGNAEKVEGCKRVWGTFYQDKQAFSRGLCKLLLNSQWPELCHMTSPCCRGSWESVVFQPVQWKSGWKERVDVAIGNGQHQPHECTKGFCFRLLASQHYFVVSDFNIHITLLFVLYNNFQSLI